MRRRKSPFLPLALARLGMASAETILHRSALMARGACSPAEYWRMVAEKQTAAWLTAAALARGQTNAATLLAPWSKRAAANARRLRGK
jgi:hypothetical protein